MKEIATDYIHPDEPCYGLVEGACSIPREGMRWIQSLTVVRGDSLAIYSTDLGPADLFARAQAVAFPSPGGCNTVAQLQWEADNTRQDTYWADRTDAMLAESTLIPDHLRQLEQNREVIANRSTFGPSGGHQRNGYPRQAAREWYGNSN